jgi:serine protease Do
MSFDRKTTKRALAAAGVAAVFGIAALLYWPAGCSHSLATADGGTPTHGGLAALVPQPRFAYAGTRGDRKTASIADVAEMALPAVVNISSTRTVKQEASPFFNDPFFRRFFGGHFMHPGIPRERRERSLGSGVIVSADGVVLTNNHVVEHADTIRVTLSDRRELDAKVVGTDPRSDVAVLRLKGKPRDLHALTLGDSARLRLGDVVLAIGDPFGVGETVTMGIVSAKGRANIGITDYEDFIQTDAAINPGNSGGALVDMRGRLVGINTAILSRTGGYQGIGFAIPTNMARPIMESLLKHGKVVRGYLGVAIQQLTPDLARAMHLKANAGVLISDVTGGTAAAKAGIKRGDVVLSINGEKVETPGHLRNLVAASGVGAKVRLEILRDGSRLTRTVVLGEMPARLARGGKVEEDNGPLGGLTLQGLDGASRHKYSIPNRINGVVVTAVEPGSRAAYAGLRPGDVILEINREAVRSVDQFTRHYKADGERTLLLVYRDGGTLYLLLQR